MLPKAHYVRATPHFTLWESATANGGGTPDCMGGDLGFLALVLLFLPINGGHNRRFDKLCTNGCILQHLPFSLTGLPAGKPYRIIQL